MLYISKLNRRLVVLAIFMLFITFSFSCKGKPEVSLVFGQVIKVEYIESGKSDVFLQLPEYKVSLSENSRKTIYRNDNYKVVIDEIEQGDHIEINGELEQIDGDNSCLTLRLSIALTGGGRKWYSGLDNSEEMNPGNFIPIQ
jgi:hypothetical protein